MKIYFYSVLLFFLSLTFAQEQTEINDEFEGESILLLAQQWYQQAQSFPAGSEPAKQTAALARKRYVQFIALKPELEDLSKAQYELAQCYLIEDSPLLAKEYFLACISSSADENQWSEQAIYEIAKIDEALFGFERAQGWYEQLLKKSISPELKSLVLLKLAQYAQQQNELEKAITFYLDLLEQIEQQDAETIASIPAQQASILALTNLSQIYTLQAKNSALNSSTADNQLSLLEKAQDCYTQLLQFDLPPEKKSSILFQQAGLKKNTDNIDEYHAQLLTIIEDEALKEWHEKAYLKLFISYFDQGKDDIVLSALEKLESTQGISDLAKEIYWIGANAAQRQNQLNLASDYFAKIQKLKNLDSSSSLDRIAIDYQDLLLSYQKSQNKTAASLSKKIDKFLSEYEDQMENHYYQMVIWLKAEQLLSMQDYNQALFYYEAIRPEFLNAQYQNKYGSQLANIFIQAKAYEKAISILTQTLNNPVLDESKTMESLIKRAACYESLNQDHLAIADYEQVFKYRSNLQLFAHAKYRLAEILAEKSLPQRSIDTYLSLIEQVPTLEAKQQAFIYSKLGYLYQLTNNLSAAEKYYQKCLSLDIKDYFPLANQALIEIYFSQQALAKLSDLIEKIWTYNQSLIDEKANLDGSPQAETTANNETTTDAEAPATTEPSITYKPVAIPRSILIWVSTRHYINQDYQQAARFFTQLYQAKPFSESERLLYRYKATSEFKTNDLEAAQATIDLWLTKTISSYEQVQAQLLQAKILHLSKDYQLAATKLESLIEQNPQGALLANIQYELAKNYKELNKADKAIQYLILIIEFNTEISYDLKKQILTDLVDLLKQSKDSKELTYYQNQLKQLNQTSNEK